MISMQYSQNQKSSLFPSGNIRSRALYSTKSVEENTVKTKKAVYLHGEIYTGSFKMV